LRIAQQIIVGNIVIKVQFCRFNKFEYKTNRKIKVSVTFIQNLVVFFKETASQSK